MSFISHLPETQRNIVLSSIVLGGFAFICTTLLSLTQSLTHDTIIESEREYLLKSLNDIIPVDHYDNDLLASKSQLQDPLLGTQDTVTAFTATLNGKLVATIINSQAPNGYNGTIKLLVGIKADHTLLGVRIVSHKETPGLGDDIDVAKSDWVRDFDGKSLTNPPPEQWKVKKDGGQFDQFTGATITPRAVVQAVQKTLNYYSKTH